MWKKKARKSEKNKIKEMWKNPKSEKAAIQKASKFT